MILERVYYPAISVCLLKQFLLTQPSLSESERTVQSLIRALVVFANVSSPHCFDAINRICGDECPQGVLRRSSEEVLATS